MDAKLVVVGGDAHAAEYRLRLPTIVGRSRTADLKLIHPLVSRKHCEFFENGEQLMVRDLGSLNGTFIGDARISDATVLPPGAMITIGTVTLRAVYGNASAAPVQSSNGEVPEFIAAPAAASNPLEQTAELGASDAVETEHAQAEGGSAGEGFDFGWLEDAESQEAAPEAQAVKSEEIAEIKEVEEDTEAETPAEAVAEQNGAAHEVNEFAPPEEQAAAGGDDDLDDFFASLK